MCDTPIYRSTRTVYTRRLATANRSHVSIHARPCEIFLLSSLIKLQNLVVVFHIVYAYVGGPKIIWEAGARTLETGAWLTPHCYRTKFHRSGQTVWA